VRRDVTVWYLEMSSPSELNRVETPPELEIRQAVLPSPELSRYLYTAVGGPWHWTDRLSWSWDDWLLHLDPARTETWLALVEGTPVGYFELVRDADDAVEIAQFGLLPAFLGNGWGGPLLSRAVERAWELGAARVTVNTCSLDAPAALPNYGRRGFGVVREKILPDVELPGEPCGAWEGARSPAPEGVTRGS
jgi:GNAT superfamily N-acetyltransferase